MYDSNQRLWWRKTKFAINDTKLYVPVVTLSAQDRLFVLSFKNNAHRRCYKKYFHPTVKIKTYNIMIDEKSTLISQ